VYRYVSLSECLTALLICGSQVRSLHGSALSLQIETFLREKFIRWDLQSSVSRDVGGNILFVVNAKGPNGKKCFSPG
jgi:hypothetical protein